METVTEYGCAHCGRKIINAARIPLDNHIPSTRSATKCKECGYETVASNLRGFQCSPQIHSFLHRFCTSDELKQLRLDPKNFVATLNNKLIASVKQELEVDCFEKPGGSMFGLFSPQWLKGLPDHLKPTNAQVQQLEALRVSAQMPHAIFFNEVLNSPPSVKKHLYALKQQLHNPDERKVWQSTIRFWVVSMNNLLTGAQVALSEAEISAMVSDASQ